MNKNKFPYENASDNRPYTKLNNMVNMCSEKKSGLYNLFQVHSIFSFHNVESKDSSANFEIVHIIAYTSLLCFYFIAKFQTVGLKFATKGLDVMHPLSTIHADASYTCPRLRLLLSLNQSQNQSQKVNDLAPPTSVNWKAIHFKYENILL